MNGYSLLVKMFKDILALARGGKSSATPGQVEPCQWLRDLNALVILPSIVVFAIYLTYVIPLAFGCAPLPFVADLIRILPSAVTSVLVILWTGIPTLLAELALTIAGILVARKRPGPVLKSPIVQLPLIGVCVGILMFAWWATSLLLM